VAKKVHAHLLLEDTPSAIELAKAALVEYPQSKPLRLALLKALCLAGKEMDALDQWEVLVQDHNELLKDRQALETLAWGVICKGESSNQLAVKANSLIGAAMTKDVKAIPLILRGLGGSNSMIRSLCVSLAASYGDFPLQGEIVRLLKEEKSWAVRLELIKAIGQLRMSESKELLLQILTNPKSMAEEKATAMISLVMMYESVNPQELVYLVKSNRAGLRELSCQLVTYLDLKDQVPLLLPLLDDPHPSIRISFLNTLALLGVDQIGGKKLFENQKLVQLMSDSNSDVAITASWLGLICGDERGKKGLEHWLFYGSSEEKRLAAGAIAISGQRGVMLAKKGMGLSRDPYVQITLALGLIRQQEFVPAACDVIAQHQTRSEKWMWNQGKNPLFRRLAPSQVPLSSQIPNYPEVINQQVRIELLGVLCALHYPKAQESVKAFLQNYTWGAVGAAASTLIQEGDEEALEVVGSLLSDPHPNVRLQAALILALMGGDERAVDVLKEAYLGARRDLKIHILEAIANTGNQEAIPFLIERLHEPFQVLRVIAATGIIQTIYH